MPKGLGPKNSLFGGLYSPLNLGYGPEVGSTMLIDVFHFYNSDRTHIQDIIPGFLVFK